jgi:hypothetical protein
MILEYLYNYLNIDNNIIGIYIFLICTTPRLVTFLFSCPFACSTSSLEKELIKYTEKFDNL